MQNILHNHCNGWFFAIFEKTAIVVNNTVVPNSVMCNPFQQDGNKEHELDSPLLQSNSGIYKTVHKDTNNLSVNIFMQRNLTKCKTSQEDSQTDNLPLCSLETDIPSNDNTMNIGTVTKSSAIAFYGICFSVLKPCSYWKSDTLHAIVECGSAFFEDIGKGNAKVSELPHALNIYGGNIDVSFALSSKGTLVCDSSSSVLVLNRFIAQNMVTNTGFLFYLPSVTFGCVFHKTKRSTSLFFLSLESHGLEVLRTNDTNCLVQTICQFVTKKLNCDKTEYCIQCLLCSCQLTKAQKLNILKYHKTSKEKRDIASNKRKFYAELEPANKRICLDKARQHYEDNKDHILTARKENHRSMDTIEKQQFLARRRQTYQNVKSEQKEDIAAETVTHNTLDTCIRCFLKKIREGPFYVCSVCNRVLYRRTVLALNKSKYGKQNLFTGKTSFDNKEYICKTCHSKLLKGQVPCQAVYNKLMVDQIPSELECLEKLEQILIAQRIVFEKIIMSKGQQRKIKGAICNVPVDCDKTCTVLPRPPERSGIIMLKLKRKIAFRGHVYFQAVRPDIVINALNWLKINNPLYCDMTVNIKNIDINLTELQEQPSSISDAKLPVVSNESCEKNAVDDENEEERDDPLNEFRTPTTETCLQSVLPDYPITKEQNRNTNSSGNEVFNIAPGENKHPVSFMTDKQCEELAFPVLFPKGRFGYTAERAVNLSPTKYFNARLLHYSGKFAMNPEYLFFAQFIIEQKKVSDSINIALTKVHGQSVTASHLRSNLQRLQNLICQDQAYLFLRQIPGTPTYWQKFMYEVVAMVKQLGIPTWFMTLSCADLRWPELFQIIAKTQGLSLTDEEIEALSYNERCSMINLNPVVVAKHFQYRVETFFTEVLLTKANPIGKIVHYALRIEFQIRGSPHLHALIWTSDCPKLTRENKEEYINFIDTHVQAYLPDRKTDSELFELVATYQKHSHSKTCTKYRNVPCRFNFGQFFTKRTIVAEPLPEELDEEVKRSMLSRRNEILSLVKRTIDKVLDPNNPEYDPTRSEEELLSSLGVTKEQYYWAFTVSVDSDFELHLKRPLDSCFINNYFLAGVKGFRANVDLQPVFNHYKCVTYVCSYFTKDETECSQAIANAAKEAKASNLAIRESLRKIGAAFLSTREVSAQECVYRCMPELWLRKVFPKTVFVSTALPEKRVRVAKSQQELDELDDDSTDVYKSNIIERYSIRPNTIPTVDNMCLAEFSAYYHKEYKPNYVINDAQPEILTDDAAELHVQLTTNDGIINQLPPQIKLLNSNEVMKCRKSKAVLRYHTPNRTKEPEKYFHHLLMLYYPWRSEDNLIGKEKTYASKFYEPETNAIVKQNQLIFEPDADAVTEALEALRNSESNNSFYSFDPLNDQENEDLLLNVQQTNENDEESFKEQVPCHLASTSKSSSSVPTVSCHIQPNEISDNEFRKSVRSLNNIQRIAYNSVLSWCRTTVKNIRSLKPEKINPIYLFITGGAGSGKSHLIKTIYHTAVKTFQHASSNPDLPTVLLMAPTGVSAINIDGTTVNTGLAIPKQTGDNLLQMSDKKKTQFRLSLSELRLIIIDEISMVSNITLIHIHQRLKEIFGSFSSQLFASVSIITVGDLYQLPPIKRKPVFEDYKDNMRNLYHPWQVFTD